MWSGVDPDVELFASGRVLDDDGEWTGGQTLGEAGDDAAGAICLHQPLAWNLRFQCCKWILSVLRRCCDHIACCLVSFWQGVTEHMGAQAPAAALAGPAQARPPPRRLRRRRRAACACS